MTTTTNTGGVITAAVQNQQPAAPRKPRTPAQALNAMLSGEAIQQTLRGALKENAGAFAASVMNLFNNDKTLQQCEPKLVLAEALKAAALKLPIEKQLGFAYVVPFKDHGVQKPQFQLGYKGYIQLAIRSGKYKHINSGVVYEGELRSANKLTGEIDLSGERVSDEIIGYFAYIETLEGYSQTSYWSKTDVLAHADKYSKSFKSENSPWKKEFDKMAMKTVLKDLLSHYGPMSVEMSRAITDEAAPAEPAEIEADGSEVLVDEAGTGTPEEETPPEE